MALAGRVDDDALTQARELLAVAELDRAVELVTGVLLAGRIPVSVDERREIGRLLGEVRSDRSLADKLFAVEQVPVPRHRFSVESDPADGLAEVIGKTASVLPDVRSVRATWRSSPAGATPGPLPQRVVLVDIGPSGFAPATAYRVDTVLRQAGIRAAVEVLTVGVPLGEYHAAAVTTAREVFFQTMTAPAPPPDPATWFDGEVRDEAPVVEPEPVPAEPEAGSKSRRARVDPFEGSQPFPPKPVKRLPVRDAADPATPPPATPPPATPSHLTPSHTAPSHLTPSHTAPSHLTPSHTAPSHTAPSHEAASDAVDVEVDTGPVDALDDVRAEVGPNVEVGDPVASDVDPHVDPHADSRPDSLNGSRNDAYLDSLNESLNSSRNDVRNGVHEPHEDYPRPLNGEPRNGEPHGGEPPLSRAEVTTELGPDDLAALQAALADGHAPAAVQLPPTVDAKLSDRERALLQQLHEELAQREQQSWPSGPEYVNGVHKPNNGKFPG
ncbi:hypothetical protein [Saccharothrix espanaensis]|uniref:hypothetical protein n=1 Tax=Saccharothrix espanaensis TaxID=103731 RepID=UPI0006863C3F|nr:hypothetical protein [Saccharothrix espanaensis]